MSFEGIYFDEYITIQEEKNLIQEIDTRPWNNTINKPLKRRVQHYGYEYNYSNKALIESDPIPSWPIVKRIEREYFRPEQLIINEYIPGQGIAKHIDSDQFDEPIISLSLGSPCVMIFRKESNAVKAIKEILLKPRSLLVMSGELRWNWTHEIPARKKDKINGMIINRDRRISLTFRRLRKSK
jgi:alkylated DNA repair dioxygenase AlkB